MPENKSPMVSSWDAARELAKGEAIARGYKKRIKNGDVTLYEYTFVLRYGRQRIHLRVDKFTCEVSVSY